MHDYKLMPKVELHLHLDGSVRLETVAELLNREIVDVEKDMVASDKCLDLNDYLTKFAIAGKVMQTKENLRRIAYELAFDLKKDGVIYAEIRFAPLKHILGGLNASEVVESVLEGLFQVDIKTNLILCMMRGDNEKQNMEVIDLACSFIGRGVVAIDLAGAEAIYKTYDYKNLFEYAKKLQVPFTIHAGEADGEDSIKSAIAFGAKRLGHGVNAIFYPKLLEEIKEQDILLEICPTSNIQTNVVKTLSEHPVRALYDTGISISISTDNRTVSNISLTEEYEQLEQILSFNYDDFVKMNIAAIKHAFLNDKDKALLLREYESLLNNINN